MYIYFFLFLIEGLSFRSFRCDLNLQIEKDKASNPHLFLMLFGKWVLVNAFCL